MAKFDLNFDRITEKQQYWFAIRELTAREIKRKYARSKLGIVWSVLNPLLHMTVLSLIFSYMFSRNIENFPVYLIIGQTVFNLFSNGTNHAMTAIADNKSLIQRTKLPKQTFIFSRVLTAFVNFGFSLVPLILVMLVFRIRITWRVILIVPDLILLSIFILGAGYILATLYVHFADIKYFYSIVTQLVMYASAIFYPATRLPVYMQTVVTYNPVFLAIDIARHVLLYGLLPYYTEWIKLFIASLLSITVGYWVFRKNENNLMIRL